MSLERIIYSQLESRLEAQSAFETKLIKQQEFYTLALQPPMDTVPGEALGVSYVPLTQQYLDNLSTNTSMTEEEKKAIIASKKKRHAIIEDEFSEHDIQIVVDLLKKLKKDGQLYNLIIEYQNSANDHQAETEIDKKTIIMIALQNAGILPVIQYVICDSLLTGGQGCGQTKTSITDNSAGMIQELMPLITATGFTLEEFFTLSNQKVVLFKSFAEMAITLDNPAILLTIMGKKKFQTEDVQKQHNPFTEQTIKELILSSDKPAIISRMSDDLAAEHQEKQQQRQKKVLMPLRRKSSPSAELMAELTPTHKKVVAENDKPKSTCSQSQQEPKRLAPYAEGKLHLHASNANKPMQDSILCLLVSTVSNIIHNAEIYNTKYPDPVKKIKGSHTHQPQAKLLIESGKIFHHKILTAKDNETANITMNFLAVFDTLTSGLGAGELRKMILTHKILYPLGLAAQAIRNRNLDKNTNAHIKLSLKHLSVHAIQPEPRQNMQARI